MKRIICLALALVLLSTPALALQEHSNFAVGMGFMEEVSENEVTRGGFAEVLCRVLGLELETEQDAADEWYNGLFTEDNTDVIIDNSGFSQKFLDVPATHSNYDAITKVAELGYMVGNGDGLFGPDSVITEQEAVKVLVTITGNSYLANSQGGYPYGYNLVAATNKMFEGMTFTGNSPLTYEKLAVLIYNTVKMKVTVNTFENDKVVFSVSEETILGRVHNVVQSEGRMEANEFTALDAMDNAGENCVVISGVKYGINEAPYVRDFIGYDVEFYYKADDKEILYAQIDKNCEIKKFDSKEIEKLKDNRLYYYTDESKSDTEYEELAKNLNVIYNGSYQKEYKENILNFEFGDVTLIKSQSENLYDTVIINSYETYMLTDIDAEKTGVYASKVAEKNAQFFDLSKVKINCYNEEGTPVSLAELKKGSVVDIAKGDKWAIVKVASVKKENCLIKGIEYDDEISFITEDAKYPVYSKWYNSLESKPLAGKSYTVYLNTFGYVCKIEQKTQELAGEYNLFINSEYDSKLSSKAIKIKAVNSKGNVVVYEIDKDVRILKGSSIIKEKSNKALYDSVKGILKEHTVFLVTTNDEGKIVKLELPAEETERKNMLGEMSSGEKVAFITSPAYMFENRTIVSNAKTVFNINAKSTDEDRKYTTISANSLIDGNNYKMAAYNRNSNSVLAECVVVYSDSATESIGQYNEKLYIVDKVLTQRDENGDENAVLYGYSIARESNNLESVVIESATGKELKQYKDFFGNTYTPQKGDVLMIKLFNGEVDNVYLLYREGLAGTTGVFDSEKSNPFGLSNALVPTSNDMNRYRAGSARFFAGYVTDIEESKYMSYTNFLANAEKDLKDSKYLTETTVIPANVVIVESKPFIVRKGSYADIKTYRNYGNDCSEMLIHTDSGRVRHLIIFN